MNTQEPIKVVWLVTGPEGETWICSTKRRALRLAQAYDSEYTLTWDNEKKGHTKHVYTSYWYYTFRLLEVDSIDDEYDQANTLAADLDDFLEVLWEKRGKVGECPSISFVSVMPRTKGLTVEVRVKNAGWCNPCELSLYVPDIESFQSHFQQWVLDCFDPKGAE